MLLLNSGPGQHTRPQFLKLHRRELTRTYHHVGNISHQAKAWPGQGPERPGSDTVDHGLNFHSVCVSPLRIRMN